MKKNGTYLRNPVPFGLVMSSNPAKKKRRGHTRRKARASSTAGKVVVLRKATRNPAKKKRSSSRKRPAVVTAAAKPVFTPAPKKKRKTVRKRRIKNPSSPKEIFSPMKTKRRRSRSRTRNPARRSSRRRSRNPSRRRSRSRRMRNPSRIVSELFNPNMLTAAAGITLATLGTQIVMNKLTTTTATQPRPFDLPMVDYSVGGAEFSAKNKWPLLLYQVAIPAAAGYFLRNQSPRLAQGLLLGATFNAVAGAVKNSGVLDQYGVARNFNPRNGMGFLPGTPTMFTGPAQNFLAPRVNNVPMPRGMNAMVGPGSFNSVANSTEGAFRGAN